MAQGICRIKELMKDGLILSQELNKLFWARKLAETATEGNKK